ncbi:laccase IV [Purpureocillium lavendulum]|uniref:Laccase IV n=1 Tax=Purpureocillium lavendulum TaxID=1247861 RepID=A0AB34FPB1_9HYPO|nr:laccase IV [Purpureocillium lavendulum]
MELHASSASRCRHKWRVPIGFWLIIPVFCIGLYSAIVLAYARSGAAFLPSTWLSGSHRNDDGSIPADPQSHAEPDDDDDDDDAFVLHPKRHIFRQPRTIRLNWNITKEARRPDGVLKDVYLINGQFPGPTVEARSGDRLEVTVTNGIANDTKDGLAVHWHGLFMKAANEMDGVVGVTQCSIPPAGSFTYRFQISEEQHGTFWYHAHSAVKRADGLYGGLVVHKPADEYDKNDDLSLYEYDAEKLLLVGDWYHAGADAVIAEYKDFRSFALMPLWNPALTSKQLFPLLWSEPIGTADPRTTPAAADAVDLYDMAHAEAPHMPHTSAVRQEPAELAVLYTSLAINSFKDDEPWGELNHTSWVWKDPSAKPLLATDRESWANGTAQANAMRNFHVPQFKAGEDRWLELVVNNIDDKGHPFHLHGYEFFVVASRRARVGKSYNPFDDGDDENKQRNLDTPLKRDTAYINPQGHVVLRLPLHNPGLWLMHCHALWHQAVGMGIVLQVGSIAPETARNAAKSCSP